MTDRPADRPDRLRWGILGTGNIARQFAAGVAASARGRLAAVASRSADKAQAFARAHQVPAAYGTYDDLLRDPGVDVVYVSLPNTLHHAWTIAALRAGKHVLCEKPFAATAAEAQEMFDAARKAGRAVMEAFMYRCHPQTLGVLDAVRAGAVGRVTLIRTSFCYRTTRVADNVRFRPDLAGGALMDVGCYCLSFARLMAGAEPTEAKATGHIHDTGVDDLVTGFLRFGPDTFATFGCGMGVQADNTGYVCGTEGYIEIPVPWKPPAAGAQYTIAHSTPPRQDATGPATAAPVQPPRRTVAVDAGGDVYGVEADDFAAAVTEGRPPRVSPAETLGNMRLLDELRRQVGLAY